MFDMDIINAAMVRQNSDPEAMAARAAANAANAKKTELNQEDFLTLMITQLKNQDPFKPLEPAAVRRPARAVQPGLRPVRHEQADQLADRQSARQPGARRRGPHRPHGHRARQHYLPVRGGRRRDARTAGPRQRAARRLVGAARGQGLERRAREDAGARQHARRARVRAGTAPPTAARPAAAGAYRIEVIARVGNQNVSLQTSVAARVSSVALDPATGGLMLDTDSLGELAIDDVERVL